MANLPEKSYINKLGLVSRAPFCDFNHRLAVRKFLMAKGKNRAAQGRKLEIKVIPPSCLNLTLAEIICNLGPGPLLWPGGVGRAQGLKFTPYDLKKKRGRKPKAPEAAAGSQKRRVSGKSSS